MRCTLLYELSKVFKDVPFGTAFVAKGPGSAPADTSDQALL